MPMTDSQELLEQDLVEVATPVILQQEVKDLELLQEQILVEMDLMRLDKAVVAVVDLVLLVPLEAVLQLVALVVLEQHIQQQEKPMPVVAVVVVKLVVLAVVAAVVEAHQVVDLQLITLLLVTLTLEAVAEEDQVKADHHHMRRNLEVAQAVPVSLSSHIPLDK